MKSGGADFVYAKGFTAWKYIDEKEKSKDLPPIGVNFHGYEMFQPAPSLRSYLEQVLLFKRPVRYITTGSDCVFSYGGRISSIIGQLGVPVSRIIEVPTGIERSWLNDRVRNTPPVKRFLFAGRYERRKGVQELTRVLRQLDSYYSFQFDFVGEVPSRYKISSPNITYHGVIIDPLGMQKIMRSCDVLVCPSYSEGMPNVIMEAMASGLAVIATDVGAIPEMVDAQNGMLIEPGNLAQLSEAIRFMVHEDPVKTDERKSRSLTKVMDSFLWDKVAETTIEKISSFLARRHGTG